MLLYAKCGGLAMTLKELLIDYLLAIIGISASRPTGNRYVVGYYYRSFMRKNMAPRK